MPLSWRLLLLAAVVFLALAAYGLKTVLGLRARRPWASSVFLLTAAAFAHDLRKVNWRTIGWGLAIQIFLALFILKLQVGGYRPGYQLFDGISQGINKFLEFGAEGGKFVFGKLADPQAMAKVFDVDGAIPFIILVMPNLIFVSAFFTLMQHLGIVQFIVSQLAKAMKYLMGTSGRGNAGSHRKRLHGPERIAADRPPLRARHDSQRTAGFDDLRHGDALRRHDRRLRAKGG